MYVIFLRLTAHKSQQSILTHFTCLFKGTRLGPEQARWWRTPVVEELGHDFPASFLEASQIPHVENRIVSVTKRLHQRVEYPEAI